MKVECLMLRAGRRLELIVAFIMFPETEVESYQKEETWRSSPDISTVPDIPGLQETQRSDLNSGGSRKQIEKLGALPTYLYVIREMTKEKKTTTVP